MALTLGERVVGIDHVLDLIIKYTDRRTLSRMMRLNKAFYMRVAQPLYHTVAVWEETFDSFLLGAHKACGCDDCAEGMMQKYGFNPKTGETTEGFQATAKPHSHGKYTYPVAKSPEESPIVKTEEELAAERDAWIPDFHKQPKTPVRKAVNSKSKGKKGNKSRQSPASASTTSTASESSGPTTPATPAKQTTSAKQPPPTKKNAPAASKAAAAKCTSKNRVKTKGPVYKRRLKLPIPKTTLLSYVRVFTLGSHHESACGTYCEALFEHMTNLEILRVVPTPSHPYATFMLCENIPRGSCPILDLLKPRKLIVRNCSAGPLPFPPDWELANETKEVVVVLPTIHDRYSDLRGGGPQQLIKSYMGQFTKAKHLKIVFWPDWDMSLTHHHLARGMTDDWREEFKKPLRREIPFQVDDISMVLKTLIKCRIYPEKHTFTTGKEDRPRITVYGFGELKLSDYKHITGRSSPLVELFQKHNPNVAVPDLHTLAKRNAITPEIGLAVSSGGGGRFLMSTCLDVVWKKLATYTRNLDERKAEIDEYD